MNKLSTTRYAHYIFLLCVLLEFLALEFLTIGDLHFLWEIAVIVIYAFTAFTVSHRRYAIYVVIFLGAIPLCMDVFNLRWQAFDIESFFSMLMHAYLAYLLLEYLFSVEEVTTDEIICSISIYLVAGIAFADVYSLILWQYPSAIIHSSVPLTQRISRDLVVYYSFVTQATVGYGDMAPNHRLTRTVSVIQAIFGVMYIAVLISRFVSIHSSKHLLTAQKRRE